MTAESDKYQQYEQELKQQIQDWNDQLEQLRARIEDTSHDAAQELRKRIDEVDDLKRKFQVRLDELQNHMNKQWENKKLGVERARYEVNLALEEVKKTDGEKSSDST